MEDIWSTIHFYCDDFSTANRLSSSCKSVRNAISESYEVKGHVNRYHLHQDAKYRHRHVSNIPLSDLTSKDRCLLWFAAKGFSPVVQHLSKTKIVASRQRLYHACRHQHVPILTFLGTRENIVKCRISLSRISLF
jgi:hypothetical protein